MTDGHGPVGIGPSGMTAEDENALSVPSTGWPARTNRLSMQGPGKGALHAIACPWRGGRPGASRAACHYQQRALNRPCLTSP